MSTDPAATPATPPAAGTPPAHPGTPPPAHTDQPDWGAFTRVAVVAAIAGWALFVIAGIANLSAADTEEAKHDAKARFFVGYLTGYIYWACLPLGGMALLEPEVGDADHGGGGAEDHVEEAVAATDLGNPPLVLDFGLEAMLLEQEQDAREVARLAEDVEILGRPIDAGIAIDRKRAADQGRDLAAVQQP